MYKNNNGRNSSENLDKNNENINKKENKDININSTENVFTKDVLLDTYENKQNEIRNFATPQIEVFKNIYEDKIYSINFEIPEFTAICPKTSLPDFGIIYITYYPKQYCLELKSLKEYLLCYRNLGIFQENVANKILEDLVNACLPIKMKVLVDYNVRGGIHTRVKASFNKNN